MTTLQRIHREVHRFYDLESITSLDTLLEKLLNNPTPMEAQAILAELNFKLLPLKRIAELGSLYAYPDYWGVETPTSELTTS